MGERACANLANPHATRTSRAVSWAMGVLVALACSGCSSSATAPPDAGRVRCLALSVSAELTPETWSPLDDSVWALELWDVDADGDLDVISVGPPNEGLSIRLNDGAGSFSAPVNVAVPGFGSWPVELFVSDLQGDGLPELLSADGILRVTLGQDCVFRPLDTVLPSGTLVGVDDMDGDGAVDLVMAGVPTPTVHPNDGTGAFPEVLAPLWYDVLDGATDPAEIAEGADSLRFQVLPDLDGDGRPDIRIHGRPSPFPPAVLMLSSAGEGWLVVEGAPGFVPAQDFPSSPWTTADIDGDGDRDAVTIGFRALALENDGNGRFTPVWSSLSHSYDPPRDVAILDLDGDGRPDLIHGDDGPGQRALMFPGADRFFSSGDAPIFVDTDPSCIGCEGASPYTFASGDLDGDGRDDVVYGGSSGTLSVWLSGAGGDPGVAQLVLGEGAP